MSRRRTPTDLPTLRRSRSSFNGALTKARDKLLGIQGGSISSYSVKVIERVQASITNTEVGFQQNMDEAQTFLTDDSNRDTLEQEEDEALESFTSALQEVREMAEELISHKRLQCGLDTFQRELQTLRRLITANPRDCQDSAVRAAESQCTLLQRSWDDSELPSGHELEDALHSGRELLTTLKAELDRHQERSVSSPSILSSSFTSRDSDRNEEGKLPTIEIPTFHGDIMKWSTFWSNFKSTIDSRERLSDTAKLIYLRKAIKDPGCQTLLNSPRETPDSYKQVVKTLNDRFDRTKEIHRKLVQKMLDTTPAKLTRMDLRRLTDDAQSDIASIKSTGHYDLDAFLSSLYYNVLPSRLQILWEQHVKATKGVSPVQDLLTFIRDHAETLPATTTPVKAPPEVQERKFKPRQDRRPKAKIHVTSSTSAAPPYKWDCQICSNEKHPLHICPKWLGYTVAQRLAHVRSNNLCQNCLSVGHAAINCRSTYRCRECHQSHHTTIHQTVAPPTQINYSSKHSSQVPDALMMTASVHLSGPGGQRLPARALIDSGAGISLVSNRVAQLLHLPLQKTDLQFSGVQGTPCKAAKHITSLSISPMQVDAPSISLSAAVVTTVTNDLPTRDLSDVSKLPHLTNLTLADPGFHTPGRIDILLGADIYHRLLGGQPTITGGTSDPAAVATIFGWAITGPVRAHNDHFQAAPSLHEPLSPADEHLNLQMTRFWDSEEPDKAPEPFTSVEEQVQLHYSEHTIYSPTSCRYTVTLPRKADMPPLGDSRSQALSRYITNERSIIRRDVWRPFQEVVQSYLDLGHAELIPPTEPTPQMQYYLPMHSVTKSSSTSTKLRVVFDGSAKTTTGVSLNESLLIGPTLHPTLGAILIKFRCYPIALTADISKMYREVSLSTADKDLHRFLWRPDPSDTIKDYRMTRVTFGVSASPYLAVRTLQQAAMDHGDGRPGASRHILESFYVDDLLAGANTESEAIELYSDLRSILSKAGFNLCKWRSNSTQVLNSIPFDLQEKLPVKELTDSHSQSHPKALGLEWNSRLDVMAPAIQPPEQYRTTKRGVVSDVSKTFDILGWIAPAVLQMKLLYQQLWLLKTGWDDQIPPDLLTQHSTWRQQLPLLASKQLPRCYFRTDATPITKQLHAFADASIKAYGAVIYLRSTYEDHPPLVSLVISKTRVAKLKPSTVPRQELCAAVLLTELVSEVKQILEIPEDSIYCWSDSSIVLSWLDGHPRDYKVFITNRIHSVLQATSPHQWRHVPTAENPADCASRGMMPADLLHHKLWWEGPDWLYQEPVCIPWQPPRKPLLAPEQRLPVNLNSFHQPPPPVLEERYSNYHRLIIVTAWCLRFFNKATKHKDTPSDRHLTAKELYQAEHTLVKMSQARSFPKEQEALLHDRTLSPSSRLLSLAPYLDQELLLRVGGRLSNSCLTMSQKHPIITDAKDTLMNLLGTYLHVCLGHCGPTLLLASLGRIVNARRLTRSICSQCKVCRKAAPRTHPQLLGELPADRVSTTPAFDTTGLDFAGPYTLKRGHTRKPAYVKSYLCLFVCLSTKAVHIEVVSDLTTSAFVAALRRFVARRGCPTTIHSDNGSNFVGARNQLHELYSFLRSTDTDSIIHQHLLSSRITWNNIPERAPHFGGLWESAVKRMKFHLKRVVGSQTLTYEELATVTTQVEACLNSRPLLAITSHDADGITPLTPGHFLMLKPPTTYPDYPGLPEEPCKLKKWHLCQALVQHFWDRWSREYLQTLQSRSKWKTPQHNLQVGDVVILKEDKTFSCHWPIARIVQTYPGKDGLVRVAQVRTGNSIYKRPVTKLALLHREDNFQGTDSPCLPPAVCPGTHQDNATEPSTSAAHKSPPVGGCQKPLPA